ncbi:MAG: tetratricopeptide repeat protein, partial [Bacteroidales bacterium]|nr:tetratricopeptide repeat protein [Bacteroidales bacterium]
NRRMNVRSRIPVYRQAADEILLTKSEYFNQNPETSSSAYQDLEHDFLTRMDSIGNDPEAGPLIIPLARIQAYYLNHFDQALTTLDRGLTIRGLPPSFHAQFLLEKGDILLAFGDPWEATFLFARVVKENPDNDLGTKAKFKKARLAYLTGDFEWALTQLDVLKASTSKPIANDAMELALFIRDNLSDEDSLNQVLTTFTHIDYLILQHHDDQALHNLDSLIKAYPEHPLVDDCLMRQAKILIARNQITEAMQHLQKIADEHAYDYLAPKALYMMGNLSIQHPAPNRQAVKYFEQILKFYPVSPYFIDARNQLQKIRKEKEQTFTGQPDGK